MENTVKQIALYGKGGIGKSTLASNISVALNEMGLKVMQVGCSPKSDSVTYLNEGRPLERNILETTREKGNDEQTVLDTVVKNHRGIFLVETGGPEPAEGCAGRGVTVALDLLRQYKIPEQLGLDFLIYDVIGDVVCGGFAQPIRAGYAGEVYLVTSGELMSLYSSNNICSAIRDLSKKGAKVAVAGLINNMRGVKGEVELMEEFASKLGVSVLGNIPSSGMIQEAESKGGTVVEVFPDSELAETYRAIARKIVDGVSTTIATPLELQDIMDILRKYQALD